jgi:hypothetical protein
MSETTYYFAGRYSSHRQLRDHRDELAAAMPTAKVTSRWIDCHDGPLDQSLTPAELTGAPARSWRYGADDLTDIGAAEVVVSFTGAGGKGGRHVEFGYALATGKRLVIVGQRENVFHCHPAVEQYDTWEAFLVHELAPKDGVW